MPKEVPAKTGPTGPHQLLIDLGPVILFVVASNLFNHFEATKENGVFYATGIFIVATLVAIAYCRWKTGKIPPALLVVGVLVLAFGGLTLVLHDENYIKARPTFVNFFYSAAILVSLIVRQNVMKLVFGHVFTMAERPWTILALRWSAFFFVMGFVAEYMRINWSMQDWINWHTPVLYVPNLVFALANAPFILKHNIETPEQAKPAA